MNRDRPRNAARSSCSDTPFDYTPSCSKVVSAIFSTSGNIERPLELSLARETRCTSTFSRHSVFNFFPILPHQFSPSSPTNSLPSSHITSPIVNTTTAIPPLQPVVNKMSAMEERKAALEKLQGIGRFSRGRWRSRGNSRGGYFFIYTLFVEGSCVEVCGVVDCF